MTYRIVSTTDDQNLGMILDEPFIGDVILLDSQMQFIVKDKKIFDTEMILSNPNYIIYLTENRS